MSTTAPGVSKYRPKRSHEMIEHDHARIARLLVERPNITRREILGVINAGRPPELSISLEMVKIDCETVRRRWRKAEQQDSAEWNNRVADGYLWAMSEAAQAWERSKQNRESTVTRRSVVPGKAGADGKPGEPVTVTVGEVRTEGQCGNPAFLGAYLAAAEKLAKLRGLEAPQRHLVDVRVLQGEAAKLARELNLPEDEVYAEMVKVAEERWGSSMALEGGSDLA